MQIENITSKVESLVTRFAVITTKDNVRYPLGVGQVAVAHLVGEPVYAGKAEQLAQLALIGVQSGLVAGADAFAVRGGGAVTFEEVLEGAPIHGVPHAESFGRRAIMSPRLGFAGFFGDATKRLEWGFVDHLKFLPTVEHLDRLRKESAEFEAAQKAGGRLPNFERPFGEDQGWFLETDTPRKDGRVGYDPLTKTLHKGLVALPVLTAIHGYFVAAMQSDGRFPRLGKTAVEARSNLEIMTAAALRKAGAKPGDRLFYGHITQPKGEGSDGPDMELLTGYKDIVQVPLERYMSWFHAQDINSNRAKRGFDGHSINNLRMLHGGHAQSVAQFSENKRSSLGGLREMGELEVWRKRLIKAKVPAAAETASALPPEPAAKVAEPVTKSEPLTLFCVHADLSVLPYSSREEFVGNVVNIEGVSATLDGTQVTLLAAMHDPVFKEYVPHAAYLQVKLEVDGKVVSETRLDTNLGLGQLWLAGEKLKSGAPTEVLKFKAVNLAGEPVWGADWRCWNTAFNLEPLAAPDMGAVTASTQATACV